MPTLLNGDYSKYPEPIREIFSCLCGETCELRQAWSVYRRLFMEDRKFTLTMRGHLGPLSGFFQTTLQDVMLLSIARLTDKDNQSQANLSIWCLREAVPFATAPEFSKKVNEALAAITQAADTIRKQRHKRIAHFDRNVSLNVAALPKVTLVEIRTVIELIEGFLNLFFWEFERTTMQFDMLVGRDITGVAEKTISKAQAYDRLRNDGNDSTQ